MSLELGFDLTLESGSHPPEGAAGFYVWHRRQVAPSFRPVGGRLEGQFQERLKQTTE